MKSLFLTATLCVSALAADRPASRPTTQPDTRSNLSAVRRAAEAAEEAFRAEKAAALSRARQRPEVSAALVDVTAKSKALEQARADGTPRQKLDASAAYNRSRAAAERLEADAVAADPAFRRAQEAVEAARTELAHAEDRARETAEREWREADERSRAAEAERMKDPVYRAAKEGKVVVGMTLAQVQKVIGPGEEKFRSGDRQVYVWSLPVQVNVTEGPRIQRSQGIYHLECVFEKGVLAEYYKYDGPQPSAREVR